MTTYTLHYNEYKGGKITPHKELGLTEEEAHKRADHFDFYSERLEAQGKPAPADHYYWGIYLTKD